MGMTATHWRNFPVRFCSFVLVISKYLDSILRLLGVLLTVHQDQNDLRSSGHIFRCLKRRKIVISCHAHFMVFIKRD